MKRQTLKQILYQKEKVKDSKPLSVEEWILESVKEWLSQKQCDAYFGTTTIKRLLEEIK